MICFPYRAFSRGAGSMAFAKGIAAGTFSFACQKRTRKAPATFEAREAAGCGSLRLLRALRGTRILQAAAPTAPPCFGRWPRSSPLQTKGCSPLIIPKQMGSIQKNPSRFARGFFVFRRFRVAYATNRAGKLVRYLPCECSRREPAQAKCRLPLRPSVKKQTNQPHRTGLFAKL